MEEFKIQGEDSYIALCFKEVYGFPETTCHWGGYDVRANLEIKSGGFGVKTTMYTSTGEIFQFFQELLQCNDQLKGTFYYRNYEGNLDFKGEFDNTGHVTISGTFREYNEFNNLLKFEFMTDQSYLSHAIQELRHITSKYGGMEGLKGSSI